LKCREETPTLSDGINPPTVFEFDTRRNGVLPGHVPVEIDGPGRSDRVAAAIAAAINSVGTTLFIDAALTTSDDTVVNLINIQTGALGNQPISETVGDPRFVVSGMSGGEGHDCPANAGCATDADCDSRLSCRGTGPKTCQ
jgi:hypothetical protein